MEDNTKTDNTIPILDLMKEYGIEFEGRILPQKWGEHTGLFEEIRRIGGLKPDEFGAMFKPDDKYFIDKSILTSELISEAWLCFQSMNTEQGWRKEVEGRAFKCFDSEVICHNCLKRRWKPKFEAKPIDPAEAQRLHRRRQRRKMCTCTLLQQAGISLNDHQSFRLFTRELDRTMQHDDLPEDVRKRLGKRRPDGVVGLRITPTLRHFMPSLRVKYCPFNNGRPDIAYPFIVMEAKTAESRVATFGSILRQTAFVIRTCLQLQQNLENESGVPHQCIVWSFANIGEEWRLYAAVPNGSKVKIFDLWHGTVLFPEGALQLILIIDYICDWACEIYRMSVMGCLAGGGTNLLNSRLSPSGTDKSSLAGDPELRELRAMSLSLRSSLPPDVSIGRNSEFINSRSARFPEIEPLVQIIRSPSSDVRDGNNWQRWATTEEDWSPWARKAAIRHSNRVELGYLQITIPEQIPLLKDCLKSCFPSFSGKEAARKLLISLEDDNLAFTSSVKATHWQGNRLNELVLPIRALLYMRSGLRPQDWQLTRRMICILCSVEAVQGLSKIAEYSPSITRSPHHNDDIQYERFREALNSLNLIGGSRSADLALKRHQLCLRDVGDGAGSSNFKWSEFSPHKDGGVTGAELEGVLSHTLKYQGVPIPNHLKQYIKKKVDLFIVPPSGDQQSPVATVIQLSNFRTNGILIKRPKAGLAEAAQEFCFLVMDENICFNDDFALGQLLDESREANELYTMAAADAGYSNIDRASIKTWARILMGRLPRDTTLD